MQRQFKIRIYCNDKIERKEIMLLKKKPINKKTFNPLILRSVEYIESIILLFKTFGGYWDNNNQKFIEPFTVKSLEFHCNREISEDEFKKFINRMKSSGYKSKSKINPHKIEFVAIDNIDGQTKYSPLITYDFLTCKQIENFYFLKRTNKSYSYSNQKLYVKV